MSGLVSVVRVSVKHREVISNITMTMGIQNGIENGSGFRCRLYAGCDEANK